MSRPVRAIIHRDALRHNLQRVRALAPGASVMGVIKADAYGHGAIGTAAEIESEVQGFGVAGIEEAQALRAAGCLARIFLLSGFHHRDEIDYAAAHAITPVLHSRWQIDMLGAHALHRELPVWLKVDSGMHRLGFDPEQLSDALGALDRIARLRVEVLMSHLASADTVASESGSAQLRSFHAATSSYHFGRSVANSAGICAWPGSHYQWVRPGIMLYGSSPLLGHAESTLELRPAMTLRSRLIAVKQLKRGDRVGYGGDWVCERDQRVGVVACGYGDGYPRHAPSGTPVWIRGKTAGIAGRVSMDMMSIDLSGIDAARPGDEVELWGRNLPVREVAERAGTISYELLCGVTDRVQRVWDAAS